jgi:hypothetical protein
MPDALQLALGLAEQRALLGAVDAQHGRDGALASAQVRAQRHVLQHRHVGHHLHVLEGARHAALRDLPRAQPSADGLAPEAHRAARERQHAGHQVEGGRLARAVRPDQADDLRRRAFES